MNIELRKTLSSVVQQILFLFVNLKQDPVMHELSQHYTVVEISSKWYIFRECISTGAASVQTCRSLGHHSLHLRILRLLMPYAPADFEAYSYLQQSRSKFLTHGPVIFSLICCFSLIPNNFGIKFIILNHCAGCNSHSEIGEYGSPRLPTRKK